MQRFLPVLLVSILISLYPLAIYAGMASIEPSILLAGLLLLAGIRIGLTARKSVNRKISAVAVIAAAGTIAYHDVGNIVALRFYPVIIGVIFFGIFASSLLTGTPVIERFARLREDPLPPTAIRYTRKLTLAWTALILCNTLVALYTALFTSFATWALYNGLLSYVIMGGFFAAEWLFRQRFIQRHP